MSAYAVVNPMWDELAQHVTESTLWSGMRELAWNSPVGAARFEYASRFAWTVTAPDTVEFIARNLRSSAIDPLAGSGYWAFLLEQMGVDMVASDIKPPTIDNRGRRHHYNQFHHHGQHRRVFQINGIDAVRCTDPERSLLLSWPPYDDPIGALIVEAFCGDRIVYIGEGEGGCCGSDLMFDLLRTGWVEVATHFPVQWFGMRDFVAVYDRKAGEQT